MLAEMFETEARTAGVSISTVRVTPSALGLLQVAKVPPLAAAAGAGAGAAARAAGWPVVLVIAGAAAGA